MGLLALPIHLLCSATSGAAPDTTPNSFSFTDQISVSLSSTITSAAITVAGINAPATITVTGGTYDINSSGSFTSSSGTVNNGDTVRARHTSSGSNSTATNTAVTIGGVADTFTSTTLSTSGATLVSGTLTVTGSSFGSAPNAPLKDMTLQSSTTGDDCLTVFDFFNEDGTGGRVQYKVDNSNGIVAGYGAMKHTWNGTGDETTGGNGFPQAGWKFASGLESLYLNQHVKIIRTSGPATTTLAQIKCGRSGYSTGLLNTPGATTSGARLYGASGPKYYPNHYDGATWQNEEPDWRSHSQAISNFAELGTHVDWLDDGWHNHRSYFELNTLGSANGKIRLWNDGQLRFTDNAIEPRDQSGDKIDFLIPYPGITNGYTSAAGGFRTYAVYLSKIFVAETPQTVNLINASSWASQTSAIPLTWDSWSSTSIVCTNVKQPSGYNWVAVLQADGSTTQVFAL